jgi:hypothetical protein
MEPIVRLVVFRVFDVAPFVEGKRWIGNHDVELHQGVLSQPAPGYGACRTIRPGPDQKSVQKHIHLTQRPCRSVGFHTIERYISFAPWCWAGTACPILISSESDPQAGSPMRLPGCG